MAIENTPSLSLESQVEVVAGGSKDELEEGKDPGHSAENSECRAMLLVMFLSLQIVP